MGNWFGDEDDWYNQVADAEREMQNQMEEDNVATGPGALAFFGPSVGSGAGALLGRTTFARRAAGVVGLDLATGSGPASSTVEETTGVESEEVVADAADAVPGVFDTVQDIAEDPPTPPSTNVLPEWLRSLLQRPQLLITVVAAFAALLVLDPLINLLTAALGGTE
jgi:hypothetical protein